MVHWPPLRRPDLLHPALGPASPLDPDLRASLVAWVLRVRAAASEGPCHAPAAPGPGPGPGPYSPSEVAAVLGRSVRWVLGKMATGELPYCQVGARTRRVRAEDLARFLRARAKG